MKKKIRDNFSSNAAVYLSWLNCILVICFVVVGFGVIDIFSGPNVPIWKYLPILSLINLSALTLFSLKHSKAFHSVALELENNAPPATAPLRILTQEERQKYQQLILKIMTDDKPYLNPTFSLRELSELMGLKPYRVSELIGKCFEMNFYTLVNKYRVEYAREILIDPKYSHLNMLGIANECGFNSKSVFNDVFKKTTTFTPSEYRLNALAQIKT